MPSLWDLIKNDMPIQEGVGKVKSIWDDSNTLQKISMTQIPGIADAAGLAGDVQSMYENPEERTLVNAGLAAAGALPFVPSGMGTVKRAVKGNRAVNHDMYGAQVPAYHNRGYVYDDVKADFLNHLPEDASFDEAMDYANSSSPEIKRLMRALEKDDWLGFDYPSQAISSALSEDLTSFDVSPGLKQAIGRLVNK